MSDVVLRATGLEKVYSPGQHNEVRALRGISAEFRSGEFVAIIGPSGSGKSTFMHLLGGLDRPTMGDVELSGRVYSHLSDNALADLRARAIGFIFQGFNLLPTLTASENVVLAGEYAGVPRAKQGAQAEALLRHVGLNDRLDHKPSELSGGEQQRVTIARALMNDAPVILADEPTGELDTKNADGIVSLLQQLVREQGKTVLMVTHNEALTSHCDRTIKITDGRIVT